MLDVRGVGVEQRLVSSLINFVISRYGSVLRFFVSAMPILRHQPGFYFLIHCDISK